MSTVTRTHTTSAFANPHKRCTRCHQPVTGWHSPDSCGCETTVWNAPCECEAGDYSDCPSWSPIDGCECPKVLGRPRHEPPTA